MLFVDNVGDAPPRGFCGGAGKKWDTKYGIRTCPTIIPNDLTGPQAPALFKRIQDNCLIYNVLQISSFQDAMVEGFNNTARNFGGKERFRVYDMKQQRSNIDFGGVEQSIIQSIKDLVEKTNSYLNNPAGPRDACIQI